MVYAGELDSLVLGTMCNEPGPWTQRELSREFGEGPQAVDALARLRARGLVAELDGGFYAATAAGRYAHQVREEGS